MFTSETEEKEVKVLSSMMVRYHKLMLTVDPEEVGVTELVYYPALERILEEYDDIDEIKAQIQQECH